MKSISANLNIMIKASEKASKVLIRDFGEIENLQVTKKGPKDFVTNSDLKTEKIIIDELKKAKPNYSILSEEKGIENNKDKNNTWIIDPIDGTNNLIKDYPFYAVSICGLVENDIKIACVYDISRGEIFYSEKGKGAFLNQRPICVSNVNSLQDSIVATGFVMSKVDYAAENFENLKKIFFKCKSFRRLGSASLDLAYLAAGRLDACWFMGLEKWDFAAGCLLVTEAGGKISAFKNKDFSLDSPTMIASNTQIHNELSDLFD